MAVSQYDKEHLTSDQQAQIQAVTDAAQAGSMDWATAHSIAEGIRSQAAGGGYSGGNYGNEYNPISAGSGSSGGGNHNSGSTGGVSWNADTDYSAVLSNAMQNNNTDVDWLQNLLNSRTAKATSTPGLSQYANDEFARNAQAYIDALVKAQAPQWDGSQWDSVLNDAANQLIGMNYADWTQSEQYKALADRYGIQGKMSMQDVLGQISSRTGGLASSYATTAAQQQYNEYMSQLEEIARQMYDGDRSDLLENAQLSQSLADRDYNRYLDSLEQYYAERDYKYQVGRDQINDSRYDQQYADSTAATNKAEAQDRINAYLAAYGSVADLDPALVETSGYTASELAALEQYYANQKAQEAAAAAKKNTGSGSGGGTGGSGGRSSGSGSGNSTSADYTNVRKKAMSYDNLNDAEDYLNRAVDNGYITSDEAYKIYMVDLGGNPSANNVPTTYEEFAAKTGNSGIMTPSEFADARSAGSGRARSYANYQDYLAAMWEKYRPN